ncbi:MAG: hypothetical protein HYU36_23230 [Planctomycetes bacterium]|nr:hypothetical protein [Planctomycetota bacterium]
MNTTVATWGEFQERWSGVHNFLMTAECVPFGLDLPPLDRVIDELRRDPEVSVHSGVKGPKLHRDNLTEEFRKLPIDRALKASFTLGHFRLGRFDAPGRFLHGFERRVLDPWRDALTAQGFTFERCYPIIFISGAGCATNYHMDFSHVLAWQRCGVKRFYGLKDPDRWAPHEARMAYDPARFERPANLTPEDALCTEMRPGDVLWNVILTPHWVEASDEVAMSINLSHGGLRLHGRLCPFEQELEDFRQSHPDRAPQKVKGEYS